MCSFEVVLLWLDRAFTKLFFISAEERMDEGRAIETLLKILPEDLSEFVSNDNDAFRQEIINWDKEQLEKQRAALEAAATAKLQKQQQTEPMSTSSDPNNDVQVRPTYLCFKKNAIRKFNLIQS